MKKIIITLLVALGALQLAAQVNSATLVASGLTCSMCSKSIFKALEKVPFVEKVDVDIERSSYSISFRKGDEVVLDDLKKAVEDAGFFVASLKVKAAFANTEVYNDAHVSVGGIPFHFVSVPKQVLNGDREIIIVDKNFLSAKERNKYAKATKMKCFETGIVGECCPKNGSKSNRIYHVTI